MAHFRGTLRGCRGEVSRLGGEQSGIHTTANGWDIGVSVTGWYDKEKKTDVFVVSLTGGSNGGFSSIEIGRYTQADLERKLKRKGKGA